MLLSITSSNAASLPGSSPLTAAFAEKLVAQELQSLSAYDSFEIIVDNPRFPLGNQEKAPTEIVVEGLRLEADTGRFSAILVGTIGAAPRFHLPLEGRLSPWSRFPFCRER
jgi:hypothetical protein